MANLALSALIRRPWRFGLLSSKIEHGEELTLTPEAIQKYHVEEVVPKPDIRLVESLKECGSKPSDASQILALYMRHGSLLIPIEPINIGTEENQIIIDSMSTGSFLKTDEFGGEQAERRLYTQKTQMNALGDAIENAKNFSNLNSVTVKFIATGGATYTYRNIIGVKETPKIHGIEPKADFELITFEEKPVVYISHKAGTEPTDFGQWSGVSEKAGLSITNHKEVMKFAADLKMHLTLKSQAAKTNPTNEQYKPFIMAVTTNETTGTREYVWPELYSVARPILDTSLQNYAIYGPDYGQEESGPNNVDLIILGTIEAETTDSTITVRASHITHKSEGIQFLPEDFIPMLVAKYGGFDRNSFGIKKLRAVIYTKGGRRIQNMFNAPKVQSPVMIESVTNTSIQGAK
jgi:hypothetical protein